MQKLCIFAIYKYVLEYTIKINKSGHKLDVISDILREINYIQQNKADAKFRD